MKNLEIEEKLWQEVADLQLGSSHNENHLKRVVSTAMVLQEIYGGDVEIIRTAVILHDVGRVDTSFVGKDSALESVRRAGEILKRIGFPQEKNDLICQVISEHDQPDLRPATIEAKILKDADFLDGFGARGILRTLLWSGERGEPLGVTMHRLQVKMVERVKGLEFPESKKIAERQDQFVRLFLALLDEPVSLETEPLKGKYIIFEGTSGTGKETQARKLVDWLNSQGIKTRLVFEPTPDTKPVLAQWRDEVDDHLMEMFFYITDRRRIMSKEVMPALRAGEIAVSVRSRISTSVYETENAREEALASFLQTFVPDADLIFWMDIEDPTVAMERINKRHLELGEPLSKFEKTAKLKKDRDKYEEVLKGFKNVVRINGVSPAEEIHQEIVGVVAEKLNKERRLAITAS